MALQWQIRRDTINNWINANPILAEGEFGCEIESLNTTELKIKIGDGITPWVDLPYTLKGLQGDDGKSAYNIWLEQGNVGSETDFLNSLVGPQGAQGIQGIKGDDGDTGPQGEKGDDGEKGDQGDKGDQGEKGDDGTQGIQGDKGDKGDDGDKGDKGDSGLDGSDGVDGVDGAKGDQGDQGIQGVQGDQGIQGIQGPAGSDATDKHYAHTQTSASSSWSINHNLDKYPSVVITDSGGNKVMGDINYIDEDNLTVTFTASFSGRAYLN